ncbi:MAG TPA: response regulator [Actinomycetota bacterium]|nr:response regulator [Actinomycetota bacterium]
MADEPRAMPPVFVIDDNPGFRRSLQSLLEAARLPVETFASAQDFLERYDGRRPGCIVLDIRLRGESGLDLQEELRGRQVTLPIIVMTGYGDVPTSVRAFKGDAIDFRQKPVPPNKLLERVREALEIDRQARATAGQHAIVFDDIARLTPRQRQVMDQLALGSSCREIAAALKISVRTVEVHRRVVLRKMGVSSVAHLVRAVARLERT